MAERVMAFSDGTVIGQSEREVGVTLRDLERVIRTLRKTTNARDGEIRVGLSRRLFLPLLWVQTEVEGVAEMAKEIPFAGVIVFLS